MDPRETISVEFFCDDTPGHRCDVIKIAENVQTTTTECVVIYVFRRVQRYDLGWRFPPEVSGTD